ncbi:nck-associated protein 5-like, partial [Osmerus mordax]|uniref:nck-associated protein 5-like n=1 Tax=Osmerus mordax TaxID=8014 RepID=UPI0035100B52
MQRERTSVSRLQHRRDTLKRLSLQNTLGEDSNRYIEELLHQLEEERRGVRREKLAVARLQREVARSKSEGTMREKLLSALEEERHRRGGSERRLGEAMEDSQLERAQMVSLQQHVSRMEETVRTLLQNQGVLEQTAVDTVDIMKACKEKLSEEVLKQRAGLEESLADRTERALLASEGGQVQDDTRLLLERLRSLEKENSALALENQKQREQYESCLDEVANQVVQALLTQKDLREECIRLRTRVFDLEQHNHSVSVLFKHRARPSSELLLQKLHSGIVSASDLKLEPEKIPSFLFSRKSEPATHEVQQGAKAGLPVCTCASQLTVSACSPRSCSSSELSLSSTCSEYSSTSYTSTAPRASDRLSSLTWEKRLSVCSSAPGSEGPPLGELLPSGRKERCILDGLRQLQRPSSSCKASMSGDKDCMNSNEGIYSLGVKGGGRGVSRLASPGVRKFSYDSDDADDESPRVGGGAGEEGRRDCRGLSHSVLDSLCSWEGLLDAEAAGRSSDEPPPPYSSREHPQELMSFINSFLSGGRTSALLSPALLEVCPINPDLSLHLSDTDIEDLPLEDGDYRPTPRGYRGARLLGAPCLRREQGRAQSADSRPRPFSLSKDYQVPKSAQSEESLLAMFDTDGRFIELSAQHGAGCGGGAPGRAVAGYLAPKQAGGGSRNYNLMEAPERPSEDQTQPSRGSSTRGEGAERRLLQPQSSRSNKGLSVPPMTQGSGCMASSSKIPSRGTPSPLKVSRGSSTDPPSGPPSQTSPSSPPVKMSRFIKAACSQSPRAVSSKLPSRAPCVSPSSPHPPCRLLDHREPPTRDSQADLRSPSPPPPPGRTSSLLIRPNDGAQPPTLTPVRGPPPSYHPPPVPNLQHTSPCKPQDSVDLDAGYGTAVAPQRLSGKASQQSPVMRAGAEHHVGRCKGTSKRTPSKLHLSSAASGGVPDRPDTNTNSRSPKKPSSVPADSPLHGTFKKVSANEMACPPCYKVSSSHPPCHSERQDAVSPCPQAGASPTRTGPPNLHEKNSKTRIPSGFKAFVRSPPSHRTGPSLPGKQEKDHLNAVSRETSNASTQCDPPPLSAAPPGIPLVQAGGGHKAVRDLFKRSTSVTTKPHLKPALGMTGAKARSQSFSTSCMERTSVSTTRTQIITNSGERGNSLTRQSLLVDGLPGRASGEGAPSCPGKRLSHHGGVFTSHQETEDLLKFCSPGESGSKEGRCLAPVDQMGLKGSRRPAGEASQPCPPRPSEAPAGRARSEPPGPSQTSPPSRLEEQGSPPGCTIEEKVMLGIQENVQKGQGQEKTLPSEPRQKTGPSLANWFGLRRAKPPAPDATSDGRKEVKKGAVLAGRQIKTHKKDKRRKADGPCKDSQDQMLCENSNKLSSIMDHCNLQMGQIANQIQCSTVYIGKDQFMKDLLGRSVGVKGDSQTISPPGISIPKKHCREMRDVEICTDSTAIIVKQKINLRGNNQEDSIPEATCQDHMIGSSSQMRTLDSGIGTFPPPDSASRLNGRHIPRSESSPGRVAGPPNQALPAPASDQDLPDPALIPVSLGPSQSAPIVAPLGPFQSAPMVAPR